MLRLRRQTASPPAVALHAIAGIIPPPARDVAAPAGDEQRLATLAMIESDLLAAVRAASSAAAQATDSAARSGEAVGDIRERASKTSAAADRMAAEVREIAGAADEFSVSSAEIARIVAEASGGAERASLNAEAMRASFETLNRAATEIGTILDLISSFARKTNLLALNATIEAARAGAAGRGFAVVAGEVKNLSGASEKAASDIRSQIDLLRSLVAGATSSVKDLAQEIGGLQPLFAAASSATQQQNSAAAELAGQVNLAAGFAAEVRDTIVAIDQAAVQAADQSAAANRQATEASRQVADLGRRFVTVIRQTSFGDRRGSVRLPVEMPASLRRGAVACETITIDLSRGGVLLADAEGRLPGPGADVTLTIGSLPEVSARVVARSALGVHCSFQEQSKAFAAAVARLLDELETAASPLIKRSQEAARSIAAIFERALASGEIDEERLFDTDYQPIPGTNPQQFVTPILPKLESWLTPLQEALKDSDPKIVFCCAVDRNGYLPVHNVEYSQPQRPDDPVWNAGHCRNRRIFDDRAGLTCARSTNPYMIHAYRRDMGGGVVVVLKEYVAPITVRGRHWGGFRCAYRI